MRSKATPTGKQVRLSSEEQSKKRNLSKKNGNRNHLRGIAMEKILDRMWGKA